MKPVTPHLPCACSRRDFLFRAGSGFGGLALTALLAQDEAVAAAAGARGPGASFENRKSKIENGLAPKPADFNPRAKAVIYLFMVGGPSHIETFDPKPELDRLDGQPLPSSFGEITSQFIKGGTPVMKS